MKIDFNKDVLINYSKSAIGYIVTAINYDIFNLKLVNIFINIIITLYSDKSQVFCHNLLNDLEFYKNFIFTINHIFNPEDYYMTLNSEKIKKLKNKKKIRRKCR